MTDAEKNSFLPYNDTKPQGAADFYFVINATFRFLIQRVGLEGWYRYLDDMAGNYYRPAWVQWKEKGLAAVASYLRDFFASEPGAETTVEIVGDSVVLDVRVCPAIKHLRQHGREIVPEFCQHCYFQGLRLGLSPLSVLIIDSAMMWCPVGFGWTGSGQKQSGCLLARWS